ncbi:MAG: twin-arginine translocation signal domain-containing protein, partial [bacterium]|nr:twin-arginine translocation signal domain-containing protein [bacterium]
MRPENIEPTEHKLGDSAPGRKESEGTLVSRREFLKRLGMGSVALGLGMYGGPMEEANAEELKEKIEVSLGEKKEAEDPGVRVEFAYAPHRTASDMKKLRERVAEADVVALEGSGWEPYELKTWRDLSEGTITPEQVFREFGMSNANEGDRKWFEEYKIIYNSHKAIDSIDVPYGNPLNDEITDHLATPMFFYDGDFEKALESTKNHTKNWAEIQKKREAYMLARLKEVAKEHVLPDQKRKLNILISLGAVHTGMRHKLEGGGADTRAAFGSMPFIFSNEDELLRRYLFEKTVDDALVASALLEI